ncbi:CYTH domain-containing protein [Halobacillus sp. A1]|uniref:CYTH domain-containing protein n=1 Tax=Halobacillus sp. A1 TaxID=2880262 RepID=UPI0020A61E4F|nr:CYTH domain-containing protein [Halobacillus sp. A1]MCP3031970.1 CYTH domain-containing protein [Halobacillus sp. A1]
MTQEIEIEFKNILTEEEFVKLYEHLSFDSEELIEQTNYYFETEDFKLRQLGSALRIRRKKDQWTLTLKQPHEEGLLETHDNLTEDEVNQWMLNRPRSTTYVQNQLQEAGIDIAELQYMGSLMTRRKEKEYKGTTVVLDQSFYFEQNDYELELEAAEYESGKKVFEELLAEQHIPKRKTDNKIKRFFNAKPQSD